MNPMDLMKNLQNMQAKMAEAQSQLTSITVEGSAGGDMVKVTMRGDFSVAAVKMSPDILDPADPEMAEDLVLAAMTDAQFKVKEALQAQMSEITGGMNLPPDLFNLG